MGSCHYLENKAISQDISIGVKVKAFRLHLNLRGLLLNYQLVMNLLLRKVSNRHILKTRPPKNKLCAQVCSNEDVLQKFQMMTISDQSRDHNKRETLKLKRDLIPKL